MDVMDFTIIGKQIKQVRKERNWTQAELAGLAGIDDKYLSNIETGKDRCSLNALLSIANALNISMDFLLGKNLKANGNSDERHGDTRSPRTADRRYPCDGCRPTAGGCGQYRHPSSLRRRVSLKLRRKSDRQSGSTGIRPPVFSRVFLFFFHRLCYTE